MAVAFRQLNPIHKKKRSHKVFLKVFYSVTEKNYPFSKTGYCRICCKNYICVVVCCKSYKFCVSSISVEVFLVKATEFFYRKNFWKFKYFYILNMFRKLMISRKTRVILLFANAFEWLNWVRNLTVNINPGGWRRTNY